ncbi:hypothetical protein L3Q82_010105 [Scortum barcoo]|uniref:Uncharacterized protein n=1 Tax=Scortum barcoo TaxID=214431 RepID=A0ACB8WCX3_9TELE|nr:hypothetical protein L3Q82_010105 [Scortum barcoo]
MVVKAGGGESPRDGGGVDGGEGACRQRELEVGWCLLWVDSILLCALTVGASGLGVLLIPLTRSYLDLQVLSVVLGFMNGNWTLTPYVTTKLVGVDKLTEAHGILMLFGGVGLMLGPPVVGCFYDFTQSYDVAFYLSGSCMMAGSLGLFLTAMLPPTEAPQISAALGWRKFLKAEKSY